MRFFIPDIESFAQEQPLLYETLYNIQSVLSSLPVYGGNGQPEGTIAASPNSIYFQADAASNLLNIFTKGNALGNPPNQSTGWNQVFSLNNILLKNQGAKNDTPNTQVPAVNGGFNPANPGVAIGSSPARLVMLPPQNFTINLSLQTTQFVNAFGLMSGNVLAMYDHHDYSGNAFRERFDIANVRRGIFGTPAVQHEVFVNGAAQNYRATGSQDIRFGLRDTQVGGQSYSWSSGFGAAGQLNSIQEGAAGRTYLTTVPSWGFFQSPFSAVEAQVSNAGIMRASATGAPRLGSNDTSVSGREYQFSSGPSAIGVCNIFDQTGSVARTYLNTAPAWGFYGSPSVDLETFGTNQRMTGAFSLNYRGNDTRASGREFGFQIGGNAVGYGNISDYTAGAQRTYLNSAPHWGFGGAPSQGVHSFFDSPVSQQTDSTVGNSPAFEVADTHTGGRTFWTNTGGYNGLGGYGFADRTGNAGRTFLNATPQYGYFGTPDTTFPSPSVEVFTTQAGEGTIKTIASGGNGIAFSDTSVSGKIWGANSGVNTAGHWEITQPGVSLRVQMNNTPQWGFFGSPSNGDVFVATSAVEQSIYASGAQPGYVANDTEVSGIKWGFNSGVTIAGLFEITRPGTARRMTIDGSGNTDLASGATPTSGFITAGGGNIADTSANLVLKNKVGVNGSVPSPSTTSTSYSVISNMTTTITTKGNKVIVIFTASIQTTTGGGNIAIFKDGTQLSTDFLINTQGLGGSDLVGLSFIDSPTAASHTYDIRWEAASAGATIQSSGIARTLQVVELG